MEQVFQVLAALVGLRGMPPSEGVTSLSIAAINLGTALTRDWALHQTDIIPTCPSFGELTRRMPGWDRGGPPPLGAGSIMDPWGLPVLVSPSLLD